MNFNTNATFSQYMLDSDQGYMTPATVELLSPQSVYNLPPLMYYIFGGGEISNLNLIVEIEDQNGLCQNTFELFDNEIASENEEEPVAKMRIIPNPVVEKATAIYLIPEGLQVDQLTLSLYSMQGVLLFEQEIKDPKETGELSLPVYSLPTGSYVVKLTSNRAALVQEILIKK